MRITLNLPALTAHRYYSAAQENLSKVLERLSSGYRINDAADDPAGFAVAVKFRYQLGGIVQAQTNVETGISLLQTAEGALQEISTILEEVSASAVQAANDTLTATDRANLQVAVDRLLTEVNRLSSTASFNTLALLRGDVNPGRIQAGPDAGMTIPISIASMSTTTLGLTGLSVATTGGAQTAIGTAAAALQEVLTQLADIGAEENRLQHALNFLGTSELTATSALSAIRDADIAAEMISYTRSQLLVQSSAAMISQANLMPGTVLELLGVTSGRLGN